MEKMLAAITEWTEANEGNVSFVGSFVIFKNSGGEEAEIVDDIMIAFGPRKVIQVHLDALKEELDKEKEDFINW